MTDGRGSVVVGVTGPGRETAALAFAARWAEREGTDVVLAHAYEIGTPMVPPRGDDQVATWYDAANRLVEEVCKELEQLTDGKVPCRGFARSGPSAGLLLELGRGATGVVLQHRTSSALGRIFVGSTLHAVAAHAACPVVSVPESWAPTDAVDVVVGVHDQAAPPEVLEAGLAWADATGAGVRVVHSWRQEVEYAPMVTPDMIEVHRQTHEKLLRDAVEAVSGAHPAVPVNVEVLNQWPVAALVELSHRASLVVVGRHAHHGWLPGHLGSVPRTLLRKAACPVMVVPIVPAPMDDWGLTADEVSPQT